MSNILTHILAHPLTGEGLTYLPEHKSWVGAGDSFDTIGGVPVLLPPNAALAATGFDYREHYEQDAKSFDYFEDWHPVHKEENRRLHQQILRKVPGNAQLVLDVGCGGAWLAKAMIPKGKSVISMDISTTNPVRAQKIVPSANHYGLVADVFHLPIKEGSIDCIVASEIIEHVQDPELFVAALVKALKPGGTLIVTTPFNEAIQHSLCIHCNKPTPHNAHIHSFTQEKIAALAPHFVRSKVTGIFNSKVLVNLQLHLLMKSFPFGLWSMVDKIFLSIFRKRAMRLVLVIEK
ncbi:MAG: methyltransferase domain-containing protein [Edaphocola sp.]